MSLLLTGSLQKPQAAGGFTENLVTLNGTQHMDAGSTLATNINSALFFMSVICDGAPRMTGASWNDTNGHIWLDSADDGVCGVYLDIYDNATTPNRMFQADETITLTNRYHALVSVWRDGTNLRSYGYTYTGAWTELWNATISGSGGTALDLGPDPIRIFQRSNNTNQGLKGSSAGMVLWTSTATSQITDLSVAGNRNEFINGMSIADPTSFHSFVASEDATATLQYSVTGDAADCNSTPVVQSGSPALTLTKTGTFA